MLALLLPKTGRCSDSLTKTGLLASWEILISRIRWLAALSLVGLLSWSWRAHSWTFGKTAGSFEASSWEPQTDCW